MFPYLPVGRADFDWSSSLRINPKITMATAGEDQFVHVITISDREAQIAVGRDVLNGADMLPHISLVELSGNRAFDLEQGPVTIFVGAACDQAWKG